MHLRLSGAPSLASVKRLLIERFEKDRVLCPRCRNKRRRYWFAGSKKGARDSRTEAMDAICRACNSLWPLTIGTALYGSHISVFGWINTAGALARKGSGCSIMDIQGAIGTKRIESALRVRSTIQRLMAPMDAPSNKPIRNLIRIKTISIGEVSVRLIITIPLKGIMRHTCIDWRGIRVSERVKLSDDQLVDELCRLSADCIRIYFDDKNLRSKYERKRQGRRVLKARRLVGSPFRPVLVSDRTVEKKLSSWLRIEKKFISKLKKRVTSIKKNTFQGYVNECWYFCYWENVFRGSSDRRDQIFSDLVSRILTRVDSSRIIPRRAKKNLKVRLKDSPPIAKLWRRSQKSPFRPKF